MAVRAELGQDWGLWFKWSLKSWELCIYETSGMGGGDIEGCGFNFMFLFGEAWEAGEQRSDASALQLCLSHGASEVPQGVLCAAGGHRAVL